MSDYQHVVATGRIVNTNPFAANTICSIENFVVSLSEDEKKDGKLYITSKAGYDTEGYPFYEFTIDAHGSSDDWDFDFLTDLLDDAFAGVMLNHPETYAILMTDGVDYPQIIIDVYGAVSEKTFPYSKTKISELFGDNSEENALDSVHPVIPYVTLPLLVWNQLFKTDDIRAKVKSFRGKLNKNKEVDEFAKKLYEFLGCAVCPDGINPCNAIWNFGFLPAKGPDDKNATLCFFVADSMTVCPEQLIKAQKHGNEVLQPLGGKMMLLFSGGAGELMSNAEHANTPIVVRYVRNKDDDIISAEISQFTNLS